MQVKFNHMQLKTILPAPGRWQRRQRQEKTTCLKRADTPEKPAQAPAEKSKNKHPKSAQAPTEELTQE